MDPAAGTAVDGWRRPTAAVLTAAVASSPLHTKYAEAVDRDSAYERLAARVARPASQDAGPVTTPKTARTKPAPRAPKAPKPEKCTAEKVLESSAFKQATRSAAAVLGREITRSIFGTRRR